MDEFSTIIWKIEDGIGHLILNQPPSNRMSEVFFKELGKLAIEIIPYSKAKAVIVYGNGRHFSSGAVLQELLSTIGEEIHCSGINSSGKIPDCLVENNRAFTFFDKLNVPVIAAIRGVCLGSAMELTLFCHARICGDNALLGFPESGYNLMPGCGGIQKLTEITGMAKSMELILNGENFSSYDALKWGIADMVVSKKQLIDTAIAFAKSITDGYKQIFIKKYLKEFLNNESIGWK